LRLLYWKKEMNLLTTIYRQENVNIEGKTFLREAVRGIIFHALTPTAAGASQKELLMIYSPVNGDYKFPGGGIEAGEPHIEALRREIREESGATLTQVTGEFGKTFEYANAFDEGFDTYKQVSYYYFCEINGEMGALDLDDYEAELGFRPVWVTVGTAFGQNKKILAEAGSSPRWTRREAFILEQLSPQ
jgi:8-oxo-dGTP diphosphatase